MATSIGSLNLLISASTGGLEKALESAEKRVTSFAAKATSPFTALSNSIGILPGLVMGPAGVAIGAMDQLLQRGDKIAEFFGGKKFAADLDLDSILGGFSEQASKGIERLKDLNRESNRLGVSPQFLFALQFIAGADGDKVTKMLSKMDIALAKLRGGDKGLEDSLRPFVENVDALKKMGPEKFFDTIASSASRLTDQVSKFQMLEPIFGAKGVADAVPTLSKSGNGGLAAALKKTAGIVDPSLNSALAADTAFNKDIDLILKANQTRDAKAQLASTLIDIEHAEGRMDFWDKWENKAGLTIGRVFSSLGILSGESFDKGTGNILSKYSKPAALAQGDVTPKQLAEQQAKFAELAEKQLASKAEELRIQQVTLALEKERSAFASGNLTLEESLQKQLGNIQRLAGGTERGDFAMGQLLMNFAGGNTLKNTASRGARLIEANSQEAFALQDAHAMGPMQDDQKKTQEQIAADIKALLDATRKDTEEKRALGQAFREGKILKASNLP